MAQLRLALLDTLAAEATTEATDTASRLVGARLGCVLAVNRCYSPTTEFDAEGDRIADVVLRPYGRRARIVKAEQSQRPVTGARRLTVWIVRWPISAGVPAVK